MKKLNLLIIVVLLSAMWSCTKTEDDKKVLVVFSYHQEYAWVESLNDGIDEAFEGQNVEVEKFYMDTKRKTSEEWKSTITDSCMAKIESYNPDLLIVIDDNACELIGKQFIGDDLPVVFTGMNKEPSYYGFPTANITGCIERITYPGMIEFLKELVPDVEKVAFIADDSPTSQGMYEELERVRETLSVEVTEAFATNDYDLWKAKITELQDQVDAIGIIIYNTIIDPLTNESMLPEDIMQWTIANNNLPEFTALDFGVIEGGLCGVFKSGYTQGSAAVEIALRILDGEDPADIEVENPQQSSKIINRQRAEHFGITIPENTDWIIIE
ncbi:ABC transporter substrate-binding protein [Bacteroidota bacterium]